MRPATSQGNGRGLGAAQIIFTVTGAIAGLIAIGLLVAGGVVLWGNAQKDDQGYISTASERFDTRTAPPWSPMTSTSTSTPPASS